MAENEQTPNSEENTTQEQAQPVAAGQEEVSKDAKNMALLCHILAIFTGFLGPLILWLIKKDDDKFIDYHGKEALNFQITVLIAWIVGWLLMFVVIGCIVLPAVGICDLIFCILAAIKSSKGEYYRYPVSIRFIK